MHLTPFSLDSETIDLTVPNPDDDHITGQQGRWPPSTVAPTLFDPTTDTDTDSIGQRTLDEFADAQETRDDFHPHEGEESNSTTGERRFSASFPLTLTWLPDQSNELNLDPDQLGDEIDWDEDFGRFEELGEFEDQRNVETKRVDSPEPTSGMSSKRGFDEVDSDTADEQTPGDVSPSKFSHVVRVFLELNPTTPRFKTEEGAVVRTG